MGNQFPLITVTAGKSFSYFYKEEDTGLDDSRLLDRRIENLSLNVVELSSLSVFIISTSLV